MGASFQRFWENAIRWLVRDPALTLLRLELDRMEYRRSQPPSVRIRAMHPDYSPAQKVDVTVDVGTRRRRSAGEAAQAPGGDDQPGRRGARRPRHAAGGRLPRHRSRDARRTRGHRGQDVRRARRGARAGGRRVSRPRAARDRRRQRRQLPHRGPRPTSASPTPREVRVGRQRSVELWSSPELLGVGMLLLIAEWYLRRRAGHS